MKLLLPIFALPFVATLAWAQPAPATDEASAAMKVARSLEDAYVSAFDHEDLKALEGIYAEDVQFTADDGSVTTGRAAVMDGLTKFFAKSKGAQLEVSVESARLLTPDVLTEKGFATVVGPAASRETTRYAVTYVKKGEHWQIAQTEDSALPPPDAASQALGELAWMVGSWKDDAPGISVETKVAWTKNGHFLRRSFSVAREGAKPVDGTEIIGYDPAAGHLRSWIFDSEGGFGESDWRQDGNKWLASVKATGPDGSQSTAQHVITKIDDNKYSWESLSRTRNGEVLPNLDRIEVVRVP